MNNEWINNLSVLVTSPRFFDNKSLKELLLSSLKHSTISISEHVTSFLDSAHPPLYIFLCFICLAPPMPDLSFGSPWNTSNSIMELLWLFPFLNTTIPLGVGYVVCPSRWGVGLDETSSESIKRENLILSFFLSYLKNLLEKSKERLVRKVL